jgi:hypothetical protein
MFRIVLSFDTSLNVKKRRAGIFTLKNFDVGFELFWKLLWGSEVLGRDAAIMERSPFRNRRHQPAIGGIERKIHQNLRGLCRREDLRHDPISGKNSTELLFQLSLTIKTYQLVVYHWRAATLCPYHGNNRPWPPVYATQTKIGLHGFRRLVVDYIAAPSQR